MENYKEKYEQGLECIQEILSGAGDSIKTSILRKRLQPFFSELQESEDEKIRKEIIDFLELPHHQFVGKRNHEKWIAWLEKQGDKKNTRKNEIEKQGEQEGKSALEVWKDMRLEVYQQASGNSHGPNCSDDNTKMFSLNDIDEIIEKISEQPPADKIEPKFKVGDWIVSNNNGEVWQIGVRYTEEGQHIYLYNSNDVIYNANYVMMPITLDELNNDYHLWNISDAKDGDVLTDDEYIFIYNNTCILQAYCYYRILNDEFYIEDQTHHHEWAMSEVKPATKEQRDMLFHKIKEAGYEWDNEKKELKKVEYKFNVDDWIVTDDSFGKIVRHIDEINSNLNDKRYVASDENGLIYNISFSNENKWHKWTIADAEDGDVLCYEYNNRFKIFIYKTGHIDYHCCYSNGYLNPVDSFFALQKHLLCYIHPATKEQRDMLFEKIKNAGYEWDAEKKKLNSLLDSFPVKPLKE